LRYEKGGSSFSYEDDLARRGHQTLGQIFEDDPGKRRKVPVGLPDWFANLLPEGELRKQIIREMGGGYVKDLSGELRVEAESRFPALARHFTGRLESLPICDV